MKGKGIGGISGEGDTLIVKEKKGKEWVVGEREGQGVKMGATGYRKASIICQGGEKSVSKVKYYINAMFNRLAWSYRREVHLLWFDMPTGYRYLSRDEPV